VRAITIDLDCGPLAPTPQPPFNFDLITFESTTFASIQDAFRSGYVPEGISFGAIELTGSFPDAAVVGFFESDPHPGVRFARRWPLYDELGNPIESGYVDVYFMEDVESGAGGLPALAECEPDGNGIIWF
jgi:hypothetical protein